MNNLFFEFDVDLKILDKCFMLFFQENQNSDLIVNCISNPNFDILFARHLNKTNFNKISVFGNRKDFRVLGQLNKEGKIGFRSHFEYLNQESDKVNLFTDTILGEFDSTENINVYTFVELIRRNHKSNSLEKSCIKTYIENPHVSNYIKNKTDLILGRTSKKRINLNTALSNHSKIDILVINSPENGYRLAKNIDFQTTQPSIICFHYTELTSSDQFKLKKLFTSNNYSFCTEDNYIYFISKSFHESHQEELSNFSSFFSEPTHSSSNLALSCSQQTIVSVNYCHLLNTLSDFQKTNLEKLLNLNSNLFLFIPQHLEELVWSKRSPENTQVLVSEGLSFFDFDRYLKEYFSLAKSIFSHYCDHKHKIINHKSLLYNDNRFLVELLSWAYIEYVSEKNPFDSDSFIFLSNKDSSSEKFIDNLSDPNYCLDIHNSTKDAMFFCSNKSLPTDIINSSKKVLDLFPETKIENFYGSYFSANRQFIHDFLKPFFQNLIKQFSQVNTYFDPSILMSIIHCSEPEMFLKTNIED